MWPNLLETVDLVTFTEKGLNGKLHFFCSKTKVRVIKLRNSRTFEFTYSYIYIFIPPEIHYREISKFITWFHGRNTVKPV